MVTYASAESPRLKSGMSLNLLRLVNFGERKYNSLFYCVNISRIDLGLFSDVHITIISHLKYLIVLHYVE